MTKVCIHCQELTPPDPAVEVGRRSGLICLLVRDVPDTCQDHTIIDQGPNIATQGMESC